MSNPEVVDARGFDHAMRRIEAAIRAAAEAEIDAAGLVILSLDLRRWGASRDCSLHFDVTVGLAEPR